MQLPLQIIAAAGGTMAPGVTATFLFYVTLCAVLARVTIGLLQLFILPFLLLTDRVEHGFKLQILGKKRKYIRTYNNLLHNESYIWFGLQVLIFAISLLGLYIDFKLTLLSGGAIFVVLFFTGLSGAFRSRFLLILSFSRFIKRIKHRNSFRLNAASAAFMTFASALVVTSFITGSMRMAMLKEEKPQQVTNQYFAGYAKLLESSGTSTLLFEEDKDRARYIYTTAEYALTIESKPNAFPMLSRR